MPDLVARASTLQDVGRRSRQEDAAIVHCATGTGESLAVLSDGMGGHEDGDLASRILVCETFATLFLSAARPSTFRIHAPNILRAALNAANLSLQNHIDAGRLSAETGGTLVSLSILEGQLRWLSVGDSPLYLWRRGELRRLNEDHSMTPQIDLMLLNGEIDAQTARTHPSRNCLTSAVTGGDIHRIDCPEVALPLEPGDVVILASDGLNTLDEARIGAVIRRNFAGGGERIGKALMATALREKAPEQDNITIIVIEIVVAPALRAGWWRALCGPFARSTLGLRSDRRLAPQRVEP